MKITIRELAALRIVWHENARPFLSVFPTLRSVVQVDENGPMLPIFASEDCFRIGCPSSDDWFEKLDNGQDFAAGLLRGAEHGLPDVPADIHELVTSRWGAA